MQKIRVLVVDDELPIRESLRAFAWEDHGYTLVGEACNGKEALGLFEALKPDILVTDIVMPFMDGVELTHELKRRYPNIQVILLTCHSEFEYAKQAITLDVKDYLIKGIFRDSDLLNALKKAELSISKEKLYYNYNETSLKIEKANSLRMLLSGKHSASTDVDSAALRFPFFLSTFFLLWEPKSIPSIQQELEEFLNVYGFTDKLDFIIFSQKEILFFFYSEDVDDLQSDLDRFCTHLEEVYKTKDFRCFVAAGRLVKSLSEFVAAYRENCEILRNSFYYTKSKVFHLQDNSFKLILKKDEMILKMEMNLVKRSINALNDFFDNRLFSYAREKRIDPESLKLFILQWLTEFEGEYGKQNSHSTEKQAIMKSESFEEMTAFVLKIADQYIQKDHQDLENRLDQAINYIYKHLDEPLSLGYIADHVELSANYFGVLFKRKTGEFIQDYIKRIRMEKAANLLLTKDMKVYEIAQNVGIPNYRYFTDTFHKYFGKSPRDYRG